VVTVQLVDRPVPEVYLDRLADRLADLIRRTP
jgi:hypothetical protein